MRSDRIEDLPEPLQRLAQKTTDIRSGLLCPACAGGRSGERSLSIFRSGLFVVLKCWRDGCSYFARVPIDSDWIDADFTPPEFKPRPFLGETSNIGRANLRWLERKYRLTPDTVLGQGVKKVLNKLALYFTVWSPYYGERGGQVRYFDGTKPKAVTYKTTQEPWQSWYVPDSANPGKVIVLVEDILSALRCYQLGYTSVALLGTHISHAKRVEIEERSSGLIYLALDRDAFQTAVRYSRRYPRFVPILLDRDFKDDTDDYIRDRLGG